MGLGAPWADAYPDHQQKEQYYVMFINIETHQKEQYFVMFINISPTIHPKFSNFRNFLESIQFIDGYRQKKKTVNLATTFHKPAGEANPYFQFLLLLLLLLLDRPP